MRLQTLKPRVAVLGQAIRTVGSTVYAELCRDGTTTERGYGWDWQKLRLRILERDGYLCQICLKAGMIRQASEVDHIKAKALGGTDETDNLQSLCADCHRVKSAYERASPNAAALPEWLPAPLVPVECIAGPPGCGKTTYVQANATKHDLVLDVDLIAAELSHKPMYHASKEERFMAVHVRNSLLVALSRKGSRWRKAWLIVMAGNPKDRQFWQGKLGNCTVLPFTKDECIRRINADPRRPPDARAGGANRLRNQSRIFIPPPFAIRTSH